MTTDLQVLRAPDLFTANDVLTLPSENPPSDLLLSGAAWIVPWQPPVVAHVRALEHVLPLVLSRLPGYVLWFLVGHSCWQDDNRITRHRKLWGSLQAGGHHLPEGERSSEQIVESQEGVRYFGSIRLSSLAVEATVQVMQREPCSLLAALPAGNGAALEPLLQQGWTRSRSSAAPSQDVLKTVCGADGIVMTPVGAFDDVDAGVAAIARPSVLRLIFDHSVLAQ